MTLFNAGKINDRFVVVAMRTIAHAEKPILIHCQHGSDHTGVVTAMYRRSDIVIYIAVGCMYSSSIAT
jgi:protein tyrosine phosphatase (PTP) superfamily phosphohydrolase (DUF442 family)